MTEGGLAAEPSAADDGELGDSPEDGEYVATGQVLDDHWSDDGQRDPAERSNAPLNVADLP